MIRQDYLAPLCLRQKYQAKEKGRFHTFCHRQIHHL
jgi:hypothetical protein